MTRDQELSLLCATCGLCCDGTLFTEVPLTDEDADVLRSNGLAVGKRGEAPVLLQRCAALKGTCCSIYEVRPLMCRAYSCKLYKAVQSGEVPVQDGLGTVAEAHDLKSKKSEALDSFLSRHFADSESKS